MMGKGLSRQTVKHHLELLRKILKDAKISPTLQFETLTVDNELHNQAINEDEIALLRNQLDKDQNQDVAQIMRLVIYTGMRAGETLKLK